MTSITLDVVSSNLTAQFGTDYGVVHDGTWVLRAKVKLARGERLELGTGEEPDEVEYLLNIRPATDELTGWAAEQTAGIEDEFRRDDDSVCGAVTYLKGTVFFEVYASREVMVSLIRFAENGRFIKQINISLRGMDYGFGSDGKHKRWLTNGERRILPIVNVDYELPLQEEAATQTPGAKAPAALTEWLRESVKLQRWMFYLLAVIAGAAVFRGWR